MAIQFHNAANMNLNEIQNVLLQVLGSDPAGTEGQIWYNSVTKKITYKNDAAVVSVAPLASPTFTGTPAAPTATPGTNTTQISTTAFVQAAIAALVDSSPGTLDTLNELAAALGDDPNFAATLTTALGLKANDADVVHDTGTETIAGAKTFSSDVVVPDEAYDQAAWNGSMEVPTKNAVRDKIETLGSGTVGKYSATIGDGVETVFNITQATHGRASNSSNQVVVQDATTGEQVYPNIVVAPGTGTVTITFSPTVPTTNAYRVHIFG